tara:strand:+ start:414 stop:590 length:177 start_codon:yes stop_codon:yes gene_type:complete
LPEQIAFALPEKLGSFHFLIQQIGNKITVMSTLKMNSAVITPEFYPELKEFYNKVVQK